MRIGLDEQTPNHSTISRTRRLIDVETHRKVFLWVLDVIEDRGLLKGKTWVWMRPRWKRTRPCDPLCAGTTEPPTTSFLPSLARQSGIETPTREDLARMDRKRKKKMSNEEWTSPSDPDARITKMKDGTTHLAHKAEHAVDMESGAVIAVTWAAEVPVERTSSRQCTRTAVGSRAVTGNGY